jgi:hypothetical protein
MTILHPHHLHRRRVSWHLHKYKKIHFLFLALLSQLLMITLTSNESDRVPYYTSMHCIEK